VILLLPVAAVALAIVLERNRRRAATLPLRVRAKYRR
jgi:hypothetical protein